MNKQVHFALKDIKNHKLRSFTTALFVIMIAICCGIFSTQISNSYHEYQFFNHIFHVALTLPCEAGILC